MMDKKRVLVVDDDAALLQVLKMRLTYEGCEVLLARDGKEALQQVAAHDPIHLILLDLKMPRLNGLEVCEILMGDPKHSTIPIIICTALVDFSEMLKAEYEKLEVAGWVSKPFKMKELLGKIRAILGSPKHSG